MSEAISMHIIARIRNDFSAKFGVPRQSGLADSLLSEIVFVPAYRCAEALRGLEGFSHLWLLWQFSEAQRESWSPTVRPPRLGGNTRMGVFASRSPYRPNPIGLSSVRLEKIRWEGPEGPALYVAGADLMSGTPILDIKPYLAYTDSHPEASGGFSAGEARLEVAVSNAQLSLIPEEKRTGLLAVLAQDPRPGYQKDPGRVYGMEFAGFTIRFTVSGVQLRVLQITPL